MNIIYTIVSPFGGDVLQLSVRDRRRALVCATGTWRRAHRSPALSWWGSRGTVPAACWTSLAGTVTRCHELSVAFLLLSLHLVFLCAAPVHTKAHEEIHPRKTFYTSLPYSQTTECCVLIKSPLKEQSCLRFFKSIVIQPGSGWYVHHASSLGFKFDLITTPIGTNNYKFVPFSKDIAH